MGKGIAQALLGFAGHLANATDRPILVCRYIPTEFNRQMHLLFTMNGFSRSDVDGRITYSLNTRHREIPIPEWLNIECPAAVFVAQENLIRAPPERSAVTEEFVY
jgi:hypothetical protein